MIYIIIAQIVNSKIAIAFKSKKLEINFKYVTELLRKKIYTLQM